MSAGFPGERGLIASGRRCAMRVVAMTMARRMGLRTLARSDFRVYGARDGSFDFSVLGGFIGAVGEFTCI